MSEKGKELVKIDLDQFKMHIQMNEDVELSLHFDSPSRRFYLSVVAFLVQEMQKLGRITSIPLEEHYELLALLNETVGGSAGSSKKKKLIPRIYKKWKSALPDLESAPLFRVLGKNKRYGDATGRSYSFADEEKDLWANLFEYKGSGENVRLRFSLDKLGASLDDVVITYGKAVGSEGASAWDRFLDALKKERIEEQAKMQSLAEPSRASSMRRKWAALAVMVGVILVAGALAIWNYYLRLPRIEPASVEKMAFPLPDKRSIAVLPFVNMSADPELAYFSEGLTEEIVTTLSQISEMFVIARNSTRTYRDRPAKVRQVAEDLGVRYVLEGSVRKAGERVRIMVQLSDALNGIHLWAERYDRPLKDIFAVQDEITLKILSILEVKVTGRRLTRYTANLDAYLKYFQAGEAIDQGTPAGYSKSQRLLEEAIALDPEFTALYRRLAWAHLLAYLTGEKESSLRMAHELAQKALAMDEADAQSYRALAAVYMFRKEYERAISFFQEAIALDPNDSYAFMNMAWCLIYLQRPEEAIAYLKEAMRLNPLDKIFQSKCINRLCLAYGQMERYEEAISACKEAVRIRPQHWASHLSLVITYGLAGREQDARLAAQELLRIHPKFSLEKYAKRSGFKNKAYTDRIIDALRRAGLK